MELAIWVIGLTTSSLDKERHCMLIMLGTMVAGKMESEMEKASWFTLIKWCSRVSLRMA